MKEKLFVLLCVVALAGGGIALNFVNKQERMHTVKSIEMVRETEGNSEKLYTRVYYLVTTDKGAYHIRTRGLNAAPQCVGIEKDSTYTLVTRGVEVPIIGVYPCIISARKYERL